MFLQVLWIKLSLSEQSFMWPTQKQSSQFQMISHNHECKLYIHIICNSSMSIISLIEDDQQLVKVRPSRSINSIQRKLEAHLSLRSYALINVGCSALDNCKREYYLGGEQYLVWSTFLKIKYESGGGAKYFPAGQMQFCPIWQNWFILLANCIPINATAYIFILTHISPLLL